MNTGFWPRLGFLIVAAGLFLAWHAYGQMAAAPGLTCSPAPCVLPPTQASEGGGTVTDPGIVAAPQNEKNLLLGGEDFNCPPPSELGFHLSTDGGSTWTRHCMPVIHKRRVYWPLDEPSVAYDRNGVAYVAGFYGLSGSNRHDFLAVRKSTSRARGKTLTAFLAVQKSTDGVHWSKPVAALKQPGSAFPFETWLTADTDAGSPWVNSVYASGIMWTRGGSDNQVTVSHSRDGGATWTKTGVDAVQKYPAEDRYARTGIGKDGTVYVTWMHCPHAGPDASCGDDVSHMMFSKSTDGGSTWSRPQQMATVTMPPEWALPNTGQRDYNYPIITADSSDGPYSGNLYTAMYTWTGTYLRVQVIYSTDGGSTWSQPVPLAPKSDTHDQFFPSISVSSTGQVGASWLDRRNDPANINYQAFAAFSDDGGKTFNKDWQLTQAFSDPNTNGTGNNWMGDFTGSTFVGNNFIAAWMDSSNGVDMQEVVGGVRLK